MKITTICFVELFKNLHKRYTFRDFYELNESSIFSPKEKHIRQTLFLWLGDAKTALQQFLAVHF